MTAMDPGDGHLLWEAPMATPRGANDVEKLADLVAPVARDGDLVCVRAFQASVGCVDASNGQIRWTKNANGATGVAMDDALVFGAEADDTIQAWGRDAGESKWSSQRLRYRGLSAPLVIGRSVVFGDATGLVHMLSRADGSPLNRLSTDGSRIATAPVQVAGRMVVVTEKGGVFAFQPQ
jgi:outer membrane protein assembly factor BamB